jgi:hypothetical protein
MRLDMPLVGLSRFEPYLVTVLLSVAAAFEPLTLYALALALFGLPHVLIEAGWIRHTYLQKFPKYWWCSLLLILVVQGVARWGAWRGWLSRSDVAWVDLSTLAAALVSTIMLWRIVRVYTALLACGFAGLIVVAIKMDLLIPLLALLAIAHNFTPLALTPSGTLWANRPLTPVLFVMFCMPIVLTLLIWLNGTGEWRHGLTGSAVLNEPRELGLTARVAQILTPGLVLAQCLHYYTVIRLLPRALSPGVPMLGPANRVGWLVVASSIVMAVYFAQNYVDAKSLYAVVAGAHAWMEWPLIMLILGSGVRKRPALTFRRIGVR